MCQVFFLIFFFLIIFVNTTEGINFKQIVYIPEGKRDGGCGFIRAFDTNHNGFREIIFKNYYGAVIKIFFYEYRPVNRYILVNEMFGTNLMFWDIGYLDDDSLCDALIQGSTPDSIGVYESKNYNAYPDSLVWREKFSGITTAPSYITDLDRDGKKEILTADYAADSVFIFENTTNNQYNLVYTDNIVSYIQGDMYTFAVDDFDSDSLMEFVIGGDRGEVVLWECIGDNQYEVIFNDSVIPQATAYDNVSGNDLDNDGKPEFIIGAHYPHLDFTWEGLWTFYEATGNNTYQKIFIDSMPTSSTVWSDAGSCCDDIDADGIPEAVLCISNNWCIYKATGNNTFQRIFTAYPPTGNGRANTHVYIYDMNQNGYKEIIESGSFSSIASETKIFEIEAVRILYPNGGEAFQPATQETIRWQKFTPPGADSFELLISYNNGLDYQTITTIGQSDESLFVWTVPDTSSDSCLIAIKAFGPGVGWDESDSVLKIGGPGIEEERSDMRCQIRDVRLEQNYPNPFSQITDIRYQIPDVGQGFSLAKSKPEGLPYISLKIYDVVGQLIKTLIDKPQKPGYYEVQWQALDIPAGVYFYVLEITPHPYPPPQVGRDKGRGKINDYRIIKKMVLLR